MDEVQLFVDSFPTAPWWKRLPIIRHIRAIRLSFALATHYTAWEAMGAIPWNAHLDYAVRDAVWRGDK